MIKSTRIRGTTILAGNLAAIRQAFVILLKSSLPRSIFGSKKPDVVDLLTYYDVECTLVPSYDNKDTLFLPRLAVLELSKDKIRFRDEDNGGWWEFPRDKILSTDMEEEIGSRGHLVIRYDLSMRHFPHSDEMDRQVGMKELQLVADPMVRLRERIPEIRAELEAMEDPEEALFGSRAFSYLLEHMQQFFEEGKDLEQLLQAKNPALGNRMIWIRTQLKNTLKDLKGESYAEDAMGRGKVREGVETLQERECLPGGVAPQARPRGIILSSPGSQHDTDGQEGDREGNHPQAGDSPDHDPT